MSDLDPAHVDAVADLVAHVRDQYPRLPTDADSHEVAQAILTSTDPDVREALLAALAPLIEARVRDARADAWDEAVGEMHDLGWLHDWACSDAVARNPYRAQRGLASDADMEFIAHAREDVPALLAALDAERAKVAAIREVLADFPQCDKYDDDSPITCGWKWAVESVRAVLRGEQS